MAALLQQLKRGSESAKLYRLQNKDKRREYDRLYNLLRRDDKTERNLHYTTLSKGETKEFDPQYSEQRNKRKAYETEYYRQNKDKASESRRQSLANKERAQLDGRNSSGDNASRGPDLLSPMSTEERMEYHRLYRLQNTDRVFESNKLNSFREVDKRRDYIKRYMREMSNKEEYHRLRHAHYKDTRNEYRLQNRRDYWRMRHVHRTDFKSWKTPEIVRDYFDSISIRLQITNFTDWYRISRRRIDELKGTSLYNIFGNLGTALQFAYPEVKWNMRLFAHRGKKSVQWWLKTRITELLPGVEIIEDYQHPDLSWDVSERNVELDLWLPRYRIGVEYQGEQHYFNMDNAFGPNGSSPYCERDVTKTQLCELRGITLISIPYWWDGSMNSLSATLYRARPDVFPVSTGHPIPREMPSSIKDENEHESRGSTAYLAQCTE